MPVNVVHTARDERLWEEAKRQAAKQGRAKDWRYVMGIYQRMKGEKAEKSDLFTIPLALPFRFVIGLSAEDLLKAEQLGLFGAPALSAPKTRSPRAPRSREGLSIVAIGPRGGRIVGYDSKGQPIYEGSQQAQKLAEARRGREEARPETKPHAPAGQQPKRLLVPPEPGPRDRRPPDEGTRSGEAAVEAVRQTGASHATELYDLEPPPGPVFEPTGKAFEPQKSPAIALHEDLLPEIPDRLRLPEGVIRFPKPQPPIERLFAHQAEAAERILLAWEEGDGALLQDDAGLGKTNSALAAIIARGGPRNLIVVPTGGKANLKEQWKESAQLYGIEVRGLEDGFAGEGTWIVSYDEIVERVDPDDPKNKKTQLRRDLLGAEPLRELSRPKPADLDMLPVGTTIRDIGFGETFTKQPDGHWQNDGDMMSSDEVAGLVAHVAVEQAGSSGWSTVVFDEAHNMKNPDGQRAKAGKELQEKVAEKVLYLSATPYTNISDMHYLVKLGEFHDDKTFLQWAEKAGAKVEGAAVKNPSSPLPMAAIAATFHVDGKAIKRTTSLEGVTSTFAQLSKHELSPDAVKTFLAIDGIVTEAIALGLPESILRALYVGWARQYWETQKADMAIQMGKRALAEGKQVALFTSFKSANHAHIRAIPRMLLNKADRLSMQDREAEAEMFHAAAMDMIDRLNRLPKVPDITETLVNAFGGPSQVSEIHGNTNKKPAEEQRKYQAGQTKVVVATMAKGGTGISLHDTRGTAPRVQINLSLPWSGTEFTQVAGRSHRLGSKSNTEMHWLIGDADTERSNASIVAQRLRSMGSLTTGDPEFTADAAALAAWEFADNSTAGESDDPDSMLAALESALEEMTAEERQAIGIEDGKLENVGVGPAFSRDASITPKAVQKEKETEVAQMARDHFRRFAEARKGGRDVLADEQNRRAEQRSKAAVLEGRRVLEQIEQQFRYRGEYDPASNEFYFDWRDVPKEHNRHFKNKNVKGRAVGYLRQLRVPAEGMAHLARLLKVDGLKVDMREVNRQAAAELKAREEHQQQAEARLEDLRQKGDRLGEFKSMFEKVKVELSEAVKQEGSDDPIHFLAGNTFPVKDAIRRAGGRFEKFAHGQPGWEIRRSQLETILRELALVKALAGPRFVLAYR